MDICETLGIDIPVIQAPMAGVQNWELALAVSEAGGLGSIPCGMLSVDQIVSEVENFTARSTKPYNLNFFCHEMPGIDEPALSAWKETLATYYDEFDVAPPEGMSGLRLPFDDKVADALEKFKPPVVSFHFGLPSPELLDRVKSWGSLVLSTATTIEEGVWLQANGADVVIAQGVEAGGHRRDAETAAVRGPPDCQWKCRPEPQPAWDRDTAGAAHAAAGSSRFHGSGCG